MPTRIYLVRHGATGLTAEDRFAGSTEVPLSDEVRAQVTALAKRLRCDTRDAVYASPMGRTRLRLFNDVSHYEGIPARAFQKRLSRWWTTAG